MPGCVLTPDPGDLMLSPRLTCAGVSSGDHHSVFMIFTTMWSLISGQRGLSVDLRQDIKQTSALAFFLLALFVVDLTL